MQYGHSSQNYSPRRNRFPSWLILIGLFLLFWFMDREPLQISRFNPEAESRLVAARGDLAADEQNTIDVFRSASPSVVYITSIELRRSLFSLNIYEIPQGTGSGFVWDREGRIVTNYHVIEDAGRVEVILADKSKWEGVLVGTSPDKDLAVLRISAPADKLVPLPVGSSDDLLVGQKVFAIGNPFGLDHTITAGIVSALGREINAVTGRTIQGVIQTDAAINPGNSGGPLLDSAGRLIGVNTAIYSPSGASSGIGFAVPVDVVNRFVPEIIRHGKIIRPGLGVSLASEQITSRLDVSGVLIMAVQPGSSAEMAGLRGTQQDSSGVILGDIIQSVNNREVSTYDDLRNELDRYRVGDSVSIGMVRDDQKMTVDVILQEVD